MSEERKEAWYVLEEIVRRDHAEHCTELDCDCDAVAALRTTDIYTSIAAEVRSW